jgi:hypothetical protein
MPPPTIEQIAAAGGSKAADLFKEIRHVCRNALVPHAPGMTQVQCQCGRAIEINRVIRGASTPTKPIGAIANIMITVTASTMATAINIIVVAVTPPFAFPRPESTMIESCPAWLSLAVRSVDTDKPVDLRRLK